MAGQLMTGIDHGGDRGGKGFDRVAGHEPGAWDALAFEQLEDPTDPDTGTELAPRDAGRALAAPDLRGDAVMVEGQGDGQARMRFGHAT